MNNLPIYVWALAALLFFNQCKKDDAIVDPVSPVVAKQVKSIDNLTPQVSSTQYTWDDKGHLNKILYHTGTYSTYTQNGNIVDSNNTLVQNATYTYELDNENYITKLTYADAVYNSSYPYRYNY